MIGDSNRKPIHAPATPPRRYVSKSNIILDIMPAIADYF